MNNRFVICIVGTLFALLMPVQMLAQKEHRQFDNELDSLHDYAYRHFANQHGLECAKKLFDEAGKESNIDMQSKALLIEAKYYDSNLGTEDFKAKAHELMQWMYKSGCIDDYYHVWVYIILNYLDNRDYVNAYGEICSMRKHAMKDKSPYGIQAGYRVMGNFYKSRFMYREALKYFRNEAEYAKSVQSPTIYSCYYNMAVCDFYLQKYGKALEDIATGRQYSTKLNTDMGFTSLEAIVYGFLGKYDEFSGRYKLYCSYVKNNSIDKDLLFNYKVLKVVGNWKDRNYEKSKLLANDLDESTRLLLMEITNIKEGNFPSALKYKNQLEAYRDSMRDVLSNTDITLFNYQLKERDMLHTNQVLEDENARVRNRAVSTMTISMVVVLILLVTILVLVTISQRKRNKIIEAENKSKDDFIRGMSHEVRTPLNSISGFITVLSDPDLELSSNERKSYVDIVRGSIEQLMHILNTMLELSSLDSGVINLVIMDCNVYEICSESLLMVTERCPEDVKLYISEGTPKDMTVYTDNDNIAKVLVALLDNALLNTEQGEVVIGCSLTENPGNATFYVQDTGPGIPSDKAEDIFQRFYKIDPFKPGIGVGLTISRMISDKLGATLKLDKNYTDGARFVLIHPFKRKGD